MPRRSLSIALILVACLSAPILLHVVRNTLLAANIPKHQDTFIGQWANDHEVLELTSAHTVSDRTKNLQTIGTWDQIKEGVARVTIQNAIPVPYAAYVHGNVLTIPLPNSNESMVYHRCALECPQIS